MIVARSGSSAIVARVARVARVAHVATLLAVHFAAVVVAALLGIAGVSSTAAAQRSPPGLGHPAQREPGRATTPRPGTRVDFDARGTGDRREPLQRRSNRRWAPPVVYFVPVPLDYGRYSSRGYGGGVYDTNGRPLDEAYQMQASRQYGYPIGTPDLSGTPYVVGEGGAMVIDFGDGLRRTAASCAALAAESTPDGQARTIFYQRPADGIMLRAGQSGRVRGTPPGGANLCYAVDAYGRTELRY